MHIQAANMNNKNTTKNLSSSVVVIYGANLFMGENKSVFFAMFKDT